MLSLDSRGSLRRLGALACLVGALVTSGCGGGEPTVAPPPNPPPPPPGDVAAMATPPSATATTSAPPAAPPAPLPPVELVEGTAAAPPDSLPVVTIKQPAKDQIISLDKANDFEVKLNVKGWDTKTGGPHIHLILDNRPYKPIYDPTQPIKLRDIDPNYTLGEGQHVLVAFPSRMTHESVKPEKGKSPLAVAMFFVGKKGEIKWKPTDPTLIFSRPKGTNAAPLPPEGILVDFYLANAELGDGKFSVQATLKGPGLAPDGTTVTIKSWKPWRIHNPQTGTYSLHLVLQDKTGKPVPGAWNDTTREFQVDTSTPAATPSAASSGSMGGMPMH